MPKLQRREGIDFFMGIDIGVNGGIAVIDSKGEVHDYTRFPNTLLDIGNWLESWMVRASVTSLRCVVEKIWAFKGTGKTTAFSMGYNLGAVEALLTTYQVSYELAAAVTWQKRFKLPSRAGGQLDNKEHKERLRKIAQKMFPRIDLWGKTLGEQRAVCDSLLIADYCRTLNNGG